MEDLKKIIGKNILKLRKNKQMTQTEFANKLNYSDKAISKWENGDSLPDIEVLNEVAKLFGVTLDYLVSENTEQEPSKFRRVKDNLSNKLIITLLGVLVIWTLATVAYVYCMEMTNISRPWLIFIYAFPVSCIVLIVFNGIWGKRIYTFYIISALVWGLLVGIYLTLLDYNPWLLFIIGVPAQIAIILWSQLKKKK
ncbi:MAG: helix-turn-helix transcriptional regulator [Clostridia bacterium]|nr:helix-turn-helix transcriptional regulator [Clostridia bacterium]